MPDPTRQQVQRFKNAFGTHWTKSSDILSALPDALRGQLSARVEAAPRRERNATKELVHFRWTSRKGRSTEESRQQMRTILAGVLARNLPTDAAATLKTAMRDVPADQLQRVLDGLRNPDADPAAVLVAELLPHVGEHAGALGRAILRFPDDPDRAGQLVHDQGDPLVARNDEGRLVAVTVEQGCRIRARRITALPALAALGDPHQDNLRAFLEGLELRVLSRLLRDLSAEPPAAPYVALADAGLHPSEPDAAERWATLHPILLAFPPDVGQAGQCVYGGSGLTLERDGVGALQVRSASVRYTGVPVPDGNDPLTAQSIQAIDTVFEQLAPTKYGRQGVPLDFMRFFRTTNAQRGDGEAPLSMAEALELYQPDGAALVERYGRADCMSMAEKIVADLADLDPPVSALLAGTLNGGLTRQRAPGGIHDPVGVGIKARGVTHTNVLVPYTTEEGVERVKIITPGMGPVDAGGASYCQDMTLAEYLTWQVTANPTRQDVLGADGASVDMVETQKDQLGFLSNIQITNNDFGDGRNMFGIDLLAGTVYLNTAASAGFRGPRAELEGAISIDFRDVLAHPDDPVTMQVWDPDLNDGEGGWGDEERTRLEALLATLMAVGEEFEQPDDFVQNLLTMMKSRDEYCDLMWDEVNELRTDD